MGQQGPTGERGTSASGARHSGRTRTIGTPPPRRRRPAGTRTAMIAQITRGKAMPDLITYLFGPGRFNEHENQHLIAGHADAVFTAPARLWQQEPGIQRQVREEAREFGWEVEYPHARWGGEIPQGHVWHCSLSIKAGEGPLTDSQWTEAAHAMVDALGFSGANGKAPCRWAAVRHGLSRNGNDHIHIAVNLIREDGTKASPWRDYKKAAAVCAGLETRFGLQHVPGRATGRNVPEPSRADREISAASGEPEPLRTRLERKVRACAAAADSEARFIALARQHGLLTRPRYADDSHTRVTGYAVAERDGRRAYSSRTGKRGPVWFGGGTLATDLTLPRLRQHWQTDPQATTTEALAAWSAATTITPSPRPRRAARTQAAADGHARNAAGVLAAAATSIEGTAPGPLAEAARRMARAAQEETGPRNPAAEGIIRDMAGTFLAVTAAGTGPAGTLILVREAARLADACAARAATATAQREARQAAALTRASLTALTHAASQQAATTLTATQTPAEIPHHHATAGAAGTNASTTRQPPAPARQHAEPGHHHPPAPRPRTPAEQHEHASRTDRPGSPAQPPAPAAAQARPTQPPPPAAPHERTLRNLLGEDRWHRYASDPRRRDVAALLTQAARDRRDVDTLLTEAVNSRELEEDPRSPARRTAAVLHHRIQNALAGQPPPQPPLDMPADTAAALTHATAPPGTRPTTPARAADTAHQAPPRPAYRTAGRPPQERGDSR